LNSLGYQWFPEASPSFKRAGFPEASPFLYISKKTNEIQSQNERRYA